MLPFLHYWKLLKDRHYRFHAKNLDFLVAFLYLPLFLKILLASKEANIYKKLDAWKVNTNIQLMSTHASSAHIYPFPVQPPAPNTDM